MLSRFGQATLQQAADLTTFLTIPVLRVTVVKDKIIVLATVYVYPVGGTIRLAKAAECDVALWDAPSSTWLLAHGLGAGGWNLKTSALTDINGQAVLNIGVTDGWMRIVATHKASGAQSAKAIKVLANVPSLDTMTAEENINKGNQMPATFQQAQFAQSRRFGRRFPENRGFRGYGG